MSNGNELAFPAVDSQGCGDAGLTKREYAAIGLMQGMLANNPPLSAKTAEQYDTAKKRMSRDCVELADALLKELEE